MTYEQIMYMVGANRTLLVFFLLLSLFGWAWFASTLLLAIMALVSHVKLSPGPAPQCCILPLPAGPCVACFFYFMPSQSKGKWIGSGWRARLSFMDSIADMVTVDDDHQSRFSLSALKRIYRIRRVYGLLGWIFFLHLPFFIAFALWVMYVFPYVGWGSHQAPSLLEICGYVVLVGVGVTAFRNARETFAGRDILCVERHGDAITVTWATGMPRTFPISDARCMRTDKTRPSLTGYLRAVFSLKHWLPRLMIRYDGEELVIPATVPGAPNVMAAITSGE